MISINISKTDEATMGSTAIIYSTSFGKHTAAIAGYVAEKIGADIFDLKKQSNIDISAYDRIIFGTGIHAGKPYAPVAEFVGAHKEELDSKEVLLFLSCMFNDEKGSRQAQKVSDSLGITNVTFFPSGGPKDSDGTLEVVKEFVKRVGE